MEESAKPAEDNTTKIVMMLEQDIIKPPSLMEVDSSSASQMEVEQGCLAEHSQKEYEEGIIREHLPLGWNYMFKSTQIITDIDEDGELQFEVEGRVNVTDKETTLKFIKQLQDSTGSSMNIKCSRQDREGKNAFYGLRKCIMNLPPQVKKR